MNTLEQALEIYKGLLKEQKESIDSIKRDYEYLPPEEKHLLESEAIKKFCQKENLFFVEKVLGFNKKEVDAFRIEAGLEPKYKNEY